MSVERFLRTVERSGLLAPAAIQNAVNTAPAAARTDPKLLADHFVRLGRLSHFQARKLLDGTAAGLVLGHYHIVMPIGKGGMGTVYLARDRRSPRLLARSRCFRRRRLANKHGYWLASAAKWK